MEEFAVNLQYFKPIACEKAIYYNSLIIPFVPET